MAWAKSKDFLERLQLGSIVLYLICLGGYTIDRVGLAWDHVRADLFGFAFFRSCSPSSKTTPPKNPRQNKVGL